MSDRATKDGHKETYLLTKEILSCGRSDHYIGSMFD